jgi:predicted dinucleotide-binding enzyme
VTDRTKGGGCCPYGGYRGLHSTWCKGRSTDKTESAPESPYSEQEDRKLLEQALDALTAADAVMDDVLGCAVPHEKVCDAIAALRVRLGKESGK